jgi:hypothetical protein
VRQMPQKNFVKSFREASDLASGLLASSSNQAVTDGRLQRSASMDQGS